ncbi:MAG: tyrosine recombinase XerC [Spirochaetia bacterium]|nr:tyrosine recombinase XerC [Spirochaetia bacterium]
MIRISADTIPVALPESTDRLLAGEIRKFSIPPELAAELQSFTDVIDAERSLSVHTIRAYVRDVSEMLGWLGQQSMALHQVETKSLRAFFSDRTGGGFRAQSPDQRAVTGRARNRKLSPRSQARKLAAIRTFFEFLERSGKAVENPARDLPTPRFFKPLPGFIAPDDMSRILTHAGPTEKANGDSGHPVLLARDRALIELLYSSGMRIAEALSLTVSAYDGSDQMKVMGKGSRERIVFVGTEARSALDTYLRMRQELKPSSNALFLNARGGALQPRGMRYRLASLRNELGLVRPLTPHKFRHTFATDLLNAGADIRAVQEMLGHKSLSTTQVYTAVSKDRLRDIHRRCHPHGR